MGWSFDQVRSIRAALGGIFLLLLITNGYRYWINGPSVVVGAKPSAKLQDRLETEEKARVEAQRKALGPEGIAKLEKELNDAKAQHDQPIPEKILTSFPVPDVSSISWIPVQSARNDPFAKEGSANSNGIAAPTLQKHLDADPAQLPYFIQYDQVQVRCRRLAAVLWVFTRPTHSSPTLLLSPHGYRPPHCQINCAREPIFSY
jgi:Zn-dependent M16 (insulinase) family peptidase